jgi:predicted PurR-regulated permease PerM
MRRQTGQRPPAKPCDRHLDSAGQIHFRRHRSCGGLSTQRLCAVCSPRAMCRGCCTATGLVIMPKNDRPETSRIVSANAPPGVYKAESAPAGGRMADFARRMVVGVLVSVLILAIAYLLWSGFRILLEAFAGILFAIFLASLSDWLSQRTAISYRWALTLVVIGLILLAAGTGWLLANRLATQIGELSQKLPQSLEQIRKYLEGYPWGRLLLEKVPQAASTIELGQFSRFTGLISGVANFLVTVVLIVFVGIFGAAEPELYKSGVIHLVPPPHRARARQALDALAFNLRWWLVGQVVLMIMMAISTTLGLWLMNIPLALSLGIIAGILELIPYIGPWLSAVPSALIALLVSPWHMIMVLGLYLVLHLLEGYLLVPLVQRRAVLLPPALTLVTQILLGDLLGFMGLFVAAPLTVSAVVLLKMLYVEDTLGDETINVPGEPACEEKPAGAVR